MVPDPSSISESLAYLYSVFGSACYCSFLATEPLRPDEQILADALMARLPACRVGRAAGGKYREDRHSVGLQA